MGVPRDSAIRTLKLIRETATAVGFFREIKGAMYVSIEAGVGAASEPAPTVDANNGEIESPTVLPQIDKTSAAPTDNRKVFITHGKDRSFLESLKSLLIFGELEPVISVERIGVATSARQSVGRHATM